MTAVATKTDRIARVQSLLPGHDLDLLIVALGSDMAYLLGYFGHPSERPALLMIPAEGPAGIVMAAFESRALPELGSEVQVFAYTETQDPFTVLQKAAVGYVYKASTVAVSDQVWGRFLLDLQRVFSNATFKPASGCLRELRMKKDPRELSLMRASAERADRALERVLRSALEGLTELDIAARLGDAMQDGGLTEPWAIVASGPNGASPHHLSSDRAVSAGDAVVLDFGGKFHGYHSDMTRTVFIRDAGEEARNVYEVVRAAQEAGVAASGPGVSCAAVDRAARSVIERAGHGAAFIHRTGHGIGLDVHEEPYIVEGNQLSLEPGMTHSVEPGIYLEGRFGVRVEDIVVVTESGSERLNLLSRELMVVA